MDKKLCYQFHIFLDQIDLLSCQQILDQHKINSTTILEIPNSTQWGILLIQYNLLLSNYFESIKIYKLLSIHNKVRKRHLYLILDWLHQHHLDNLLEQLIQEELIPNFEIELDFVIHLNHLKLKFYLLDLLVGKSLTYEYNPTPLFQYRHVKEISTLKKQLIDVKPIQLNLQDELKNYHLYESEISKYNYDMVIDGANILFSYGGTVCPIGYKRLNQILQTYPKSLCILHQKYLNISRYRNKWYKSQYYDIESMIVSWQNKMIFKIDEYINDDLIIILASILKQQPIITNDKFRDHLFRVSDENFSLWLMDYIIPYNFNNEYLELFYPLPYSSVIQKSDDGYYIPTTSEFWWIYISGN
jgi:hypothetical protein